MKFKKFTIINYRAIDKMEIPVSSSLVPIIGINESGKTSILKAILSFDKLKDSYNKGEHLMFKNRYKIGDSECYIKADVNFENEEEVEKISNRLKLVVGDPLSEQLKEAFRYNKPITISRTLSNLKYRVEGLDISEKQSMELAKKMFEFLPFILYFDDFSDRVPETIDFPVKYVDNPSKVSKKGKYVEWRSIIEEIFSRTSEYLLEDFLRMEDENDQANLLSDISDVLNKEIIDEWKNLKRKGRLNLADEEEDLGLEILYKEKDSDFVFEFKVYDKTTGGRRRFNITERSKGFQWYFNFIVKLKFNSKYKHDPQNAIYLLDEPGSYLHSSAQEELLHELKEISSQNTLFYCTHSQYLLDPDVINVSSINIADKKEGIIGLFPFSSYNVNDSQGALTPLIDALHLKTGITANMKKNILITEGITDYYLISMLKEWHRQFEFQDFDIIPGAGADNLKDIISLAITWSDNYLVLFDKDQAGINAKKHYKNYFGEKESENFYVYNVEDEKFQLEDLFTENDLEELLRITDTDKAKTAITLLYFLEDHRKKERFIRKLDFSKFKILYEEIEQSFSSMDYSKQDY